MIVPPCGHTDGWCGGPVNCTRNTGPQPVAIDPPEPDDHGTPRHDDYYEGGTKWA